MVHSVTFLDSGDRKFTIEFDTDTPEELLVTTEDADGDTIYCAPNTKEFVQGVRVLLDSNPEADLG